jgi:pyruvate dehydrogenase E1 component alpha subunit
MVQERIESKYLDDEMKTPIHLCIGQEAIAVGACSAINPDDYIMSNHRGHGHYLAKGGDLNAMIAELHCKASGCAKGYGGSMHLVDVSVGHLGSSSIVGGGIPIGTGIALSIKMRNTRQVSAIFFGDGAADEGVLYESLNFAILKKLPSIFILENNKWAVCSPVSTRQCGKNVFHQVSEKFLNTAKIDGNDVLAVYRAVFNAAQKARDGLGPSFIECDTYRISGHAGCAAQDAKGYRSPEEITTWQDKCPIKRYQKGLIEDGLLSNEQIIGFRRRIDSEIDQAFQYADQSPLPLNDQLTDFLFDWS